MPKRALVERRPWLLASLAAAFAYYLFKDTNFPGVYLFAFEAGALLLLGAYALLRHASADARLMAGSVAFAGAGVVAVELHLWIGALILIAGHGMAIAVFLAHRRPSLTGSQKAAAVTLLVFTPLIAWLEASGDPAAIVAVVYALVLGGMAGCAWTSSFPRYRVGTGALFLVAAGLVSIGGMGPFPGGNLARLLAWPLFYVGHFVMCTGVIQALRARDAMDEE